jgi:hypothetical protein
MAMTTAERIAEKEELRALAVDALKKAYKAQSYGAAGRQKTMANIAELRKQITEYTQEIDELNQGGINISYGVPKP